MAFQLLDNTDFKDMGLVSQDDSRLCKESGEYNNPDWRFISTQFSNDKTEIREKYENINSNDIIFLISNKMAISDGYEWTSYKFYKEI